MKKLVWARQAQSDLARIDDQLVVQDIDFANRVAIAAVYAANFLCDWPDAGSIINHRNDRKWPVKTTPYILIYAVDSDHVRILRVYHEQQDLRTQP
ncbi:type II toxin-antitoxin system RelE/ParE family toxin [Blastomonas sp.]|uniref:type II toxin-antitoxin system RelE/ParE family toxin n=1 Tax=Blastomonas sp. TaxID=1909299 RepID=UPI003594602D